jgi:3-deoxy-D-manno-octulosonate 8-phosphate phosphatase (KDO 8-P phosphatase)
MGATLESLDAVRRRAAAIRLAVFDVDGVLTDGTLLIDADGRESKRFHVHDGLGLKSLLRHGIQVAVISARDSAAVTRRMSELGVAHVHQGETDKPARLAELCRELSIALDQVCYCGDDLPDVACMRLVGLACSVADATPVARAHAHWISARPGGAGAVRELCDLLLSSQETGNPA